jgi:hypothetical protein
MLEILHDSFGKVRWVSKHKHTSKCLIKEILRFGHVFRAFDATGACCTSETHGSLNEIRVALPSQICVCTFMNLI